MGEGREDTDVSFREDSRARVPSSVYARTFGDEVVLLDFANGQYFALDPVGAIVFRAFEAGKTIREAVDAVTALYQVERSTALHDIVALAAALESEGLLESC